MRSSEATTKPTATLLPITTFTFLAEGAANVVYRPLPPPPSPGSLFSSDLLASSADPVQPRLRPPKSSFRNCILYSKESCFVCAKRSLQLCPWRLPNRISIKGSNPSSRPKTLSSRPWFACRLVSSTPSTKICVKWKLLPNARLSVTVYI